MFESAEGCVYSPALRRWRELAAQCGYQLDTCDECPASDADVVCFMDLPRNKLVFDEARRDARPGTPFVLQILESPLLFPAAFVEANRRHFDAIVSFEFDGDEGKNFAYKLPVEVEPRYEGLPFRERKLAVMVNTNRVEGWLATRKPGLTGLPGIGGYFSGWKMHAAHFLHPARGELYSWRRRLALAAGDSDASKLEIFGPGWRGETISWFPFSHPREYRCHRPDVVERDQADSRTNKRARLGNYRFVIAAENLRADRGYISEKIFDAMLGGSVPVYLGEETISSQVPPDCFVDARRFGSVEELWAYLELISENEWQATWDAGRAYLQSDAFKAFTSEAFAEKMSMILEKLPTQVASL